MCKDCQTSIYVLVPTMSSYLPGSISKLASTLEKSFRRVLLFLPNGVIIRTAENVELRHSEVIKAFAVQALIVYHL